MAHLHLEVENPWGALRLLGKDDSDPASALLLARACAQQLRVDEALELYSRVEQSAPSQAMREAATVGRARLLVKETGLDSRESLRELPGDLPEVRLLRDWGNGRPALPALLARIGSLEPASARLKLLDWPVLEDAAGPWLEQVPVVQPAGESEAYLYALRSADLLRALGRYDDARRTLAPIVVPPGITEPTLWPLMALRRRRLLEDRIAEQDPAVPVPLDDPAIWAPFAPTPLLHQACLMELAQRARSAGRFEVVRKCLQLAAAVEQSPTRYGAMYRSLRVAVDQAPLISPAVGGDTMTGELVVQAAVAPPAFTVFSRQGGRLALWSPDTGPQLLSVVDTPALEAATAPRLHGALLRQLATAPAAVSTQFDELIRTPWILVTDPVLVGIPWEYSSLAPCRLVPVDAARRSAQRRGEFGPADLERAWRQQFDPSARPVRRILLVMPRRDQITPVYVAYQDALRNLPSLPTGVLNPWMEDGGLPLPSDGLNVLHLALGIEETRKVPTLAGLDLHPAGLARRLAESARSPRPIVILDPPRPYTEAERLECLLMRNRFAQQLAETGAVDAVLATGLGADEEQRTLHAILLDAFTRRLTLEDTCRRIQGAGDDPSLRATALFACNPAVRLP